MGLHSPKIEKFIRRKYYEFCCLISLWSFCYQIHWNNEGHLESSGNYISARPMIRIVLKNIIKDRSSISWKQQRCHTEDHYLEYPQQLISITVASATTFSIVSLTRIPSHQKQQEFIWFEALLCNCIIHKVLIFSLCETFIFNTWWDLVYSSSSVNIWKKFGGTSVYHLFKFFFFPILTHPSNMRKNIYIPKFQDKNHISFSL